MGYSATRLTGVTLYWDNAKGLINSSRAPFVPRVYDTILFPILFNTMVTRCRYRKQKRLLLLQNISAAGFPIHTVYLTSQPHDFVAAINKVPIHFPSTVSAIHAFLLFRLPTVQLPTATLRRWLVYLSILVRLTSSKFEPPCFQATLCADYVVRHSSVVT